ncbi:MAG: hypothetical protein LBP88_06735, partial [Treponema sp.]|nr:hypothetical protein [Treponema sp.]
KPLIVGLQKRVQCTQPDNPAPPLQGVVHRQAGLVYRHGVGCNGQAIRYNGQVIRCSPCPCLTAL